MRWVMRPQPCRAALVSVPHIARFPDWERKLQASMLKVRNDGAVNNGGEPGEQCHQRRRSQQRCTQEHQRESVSPAETTPSSATSAPEPGADRADRGRDMDKT